ncbi:isoprenylcysteine carboxylmethyltransferase family protein [Mycolicibacterium mucogenicum]|uniref:methyltransferase family protein n=1 Tax=Mycolicibacterium mucogenicum TaxID=56689 RepID=UPI00226A15AC|nr:isoprenylcysteine carboxylmethyltransferase family protein [Mycolicibacterium mucogenicum]MCX8559370.1 isoprenylcysteine carboxylmethyltransferase family protein [Mycolicibacterium mucogenicum]
MPTSASLRRQSLVRSAVFTVIVPGTMAGLIPYSLTSGWRRAGDLFGIPGAWVGGVVLIVLGLPVLLAAIYKFASDGLGTPLPGAPTQTLVVTGPHRYVRNPMYLAVAAVIVGQALVLGQPVLLWYAAFFVLATAAFVYFYEQPALLRQFGDEYRRYFASVPAWLPRATPYRP